RPWSDQEAPSSNPAPKLPLRQTSTNAKSPRALRACPALLAVATLHHWPPVQCAADAAPVPPQLHPTCNQSAPEWNRSLSMPSSGPSPAVAHSPALPATGALLSTGTVLHRSSRALPIPPGTFAAAARLDRDQS